MKPLGVKKRREVIHDFVVEYYGMETEEQRQFLADVGCRMYQGYYFAKPMPVSEFEQKYMQTC